jgi:hypothetical protein
MFVGMIFTKLSSSTYMQRQVEREELGHQNLSSACSERSEGEVTVAAPPSEGEVTVAAPPS